LEERHVKTQTALAIAYHPLPLRAGGGSDVMAGKSWPETLHSCDKAHTDCLCEHYTAYKHISIQRWRCHGAKEMVFGRGPDCYNLPTRI